MLRTLFILLFLAAGIVALGQPPNSKGSTEHLINVGLKGGFNSSMYFVDQFKLTDVTIDEVQNNYKVGYFGALFLRMNLRKHFLQPEFHYTVSRSEIMFDKRGSQHPEVEPDYATVDATVHSLEIPVLYGYNFVKRPPYSMFVFVGPKFKYVWDKKSKLEFGNFQQSGITETLYPFNVSCVAGVGLAISNIFFDFSYEFGLHNISKRITYDSIDEAGEEQQADIIFKRRNNIISFSMGLIF